MMNENKKEILHNDGKMVRLHSSVIKNNISSMDVEDIWLYN